MGEPGSASSVAAAEPAGPLELHLRSLRFFPRPDDTWLDRLQRSLLSSWVALTCSVLTILLEVLDVFIVGSILKGKVCRPVYFAPSLSELPHQWAKISTTRQCRTGLPISWAKPLPSRQTVVGNPSLWKFTRTELATLVASAKQRVHGAHGPPRLAVAAPLRFVRPVHLPHQAALGRPVGDAALARHRRGAHRHGSQRHVLPLILTLHSASSDLQDALGRYLEVHPCHRWCADVQRSVLRACVVADSILPWPILQFLFGVATVPLLATVEVMSSGGLYDIYAAGTAPLIVTLFVPLCLMGERLAASRRGVGARAWRGPWLEEAPARRRLRLRIMVGADGEGALFGASGVGHLDKPACFQALKTWFSVVQMLLNLHS
ncbi:uncharacterized protein LOC117644786 [Thrips palmi]|uniref:Uncharacterized protein LOC117644786 n=1 Tax=Thrips palmi TaxID=161013 RepID=A0A6P8YT79_THRPL|nr:uncharacterized protein LOC117644786 [Thrips palmi]